MATRGGANEHTRDEWKKQRDRIKQLYIDESKPLPNVRDIMSTKFDFHAS